MRKTLLFGIIWSGICLGQSAQFPSALATDANLTVAANGVFTQLSSNITSGLTGAISISACAGITVNSLVTIDSEIMFVTGCSGTIMTVSQRGFDGTTAASHVAGAQISAYIDAWHHNSLRVEVEAVESSLGTNLSNVVNTAPGAALHIAAGVTSALNGGSPATFMVTGLSPAFTSYLTYYCVVTGVGTAAPTKVLNVSNVSGTSFTVTGPNGDTETANYVCVGR